MDFVHKISLHGPNGPSQIEQERLRIDAEVAEIDARITELMLARTALLRRKNMLAPVFRLSSDILRTIFKEVQTVASLNEGKNFRLPFSYPTRFKPQLPCIKALTHVCSDWRELAINTPMLWSHIQLLDLGMASEMLIRSQGVPLSIIVPYPGPGVYLPLPQAAQETLKKHIHRAKLLDLFLYRAEYGGFANEILRTNIPNTVEICSFGSYDFGIGIPEVVLPIGILDNLTQSLRHLNLNMCLFSLKTSNTPVSFRNLSSLQLRCPANRCAEFLDPNLLSLPLSCSVHVISWDEDFDYSSVSPFVHSFWQNTDRKLHSFEVGSLQPDEPSSQLQMTFADEDPTKGTLSLTIRSDLILETTTTLLTFLIGVPLNHLTRIIMHTIVADEFWTLVCDSCHEIATLSVCIGDMTMLLAILNIRDQVPLLETERGLILDPSTGEDASTIPIRLPKLVHITFQLMEMAEADLIVLEECLMVRKLVGKPVHSLQFDEVRGIEEKQTHRLFQYVNDKITWSFDCEEDVGLDEVASEEFASCG